MEKVFWGIVGGSALVFAILLGAYLLKSGTFDKKEEATLASAEQVSEPSTEENTGLYHTGDPEIDKLLNEVEENRQIAEDAMKTEEKKGEDKPFSEEQQSRPAEQSDSTVNPDGVGDVDPNRNGDHGFFLENPDEKPNDQPDDQGGTTQPSEPEEPAVDKTKKETKESAEYK